jgi:hypothetical protein
VGHCLADGFSEGSVKYRDEEGQAMGEEVRVGDECCCRRSCADVNRNKFFMRILADELASGR